MKKLTTEEFIRRAKEIHGDKYDYSKTDLNNRDEKGRIVIACTKHGDFKQRVDAHLRGDGCRKCADKLIHEKQKLSVNEFIEKAKKVHGDKYDYSKVEYVNNTTDICIICPKHGEFYQTPAIHLRGSGCEKCVKPIFDTESFINEAKKIHGNKYDYSKVEYIKSHKDVIIICLIHGEFKITPSNHLSGRGCQKCGYEITASKLRKNTQYFIDKARKVHGDKYDYSKVEYIDGKSEVTIICPIHGEFEQKPSLHLSGCGCKFCNESKLEKYVNNILTEKNIKFERQKKFTWLGKQSLDFFLNDYNIAIECQGKQHYEPVDFAGNGKDWAEKLFEENKKRDKTKLEKVKMHNIKMMYVNEENKNNFLKTLKNEII